MSQEKASVLLEKASENLQAAAMLNEAGYHGIAASRAYYAMFYCAEALLWSKGLAYSSHGAVIGAFGREFAKTNVFDRRLHQSLVAAFRARQTADYDATEEITDAAAAQQIAHAREFLLAAQRYLDAVA